MSKIKIFKNYYWNLMENRQFEKAVAFRKWLYNYFLRKGQKNRICIYLSIRFKFFKSGYR